MTGVSSPGNDARHFTHAEDVVRLSLISTVVMVLAVSTACGDQSPSEPSLITEGPALSPNQRTASERWMILTRTITGRREFGSPLGTARTFALVAVAQYNAATIAGATRSAGKTASEPASVASASATVLLGLYPLEQDAIAAQLESDRGYFPSFGSERDADYASGSTVGTTVGTAVLARAAGDRTSAAFVGTMPSGPDKWVPAPNTQPVSPRWGEARGWFLASGNQFRPAPPPALNSSEFTVALAEVKAFTDGRTPEQLALAQFWQGGSGPGGPMGYFQELAAGLTTASNLNERRTARSFALLHMAMFDATISCWDAKYAYWFLRPFQADVRITTPVGRPNFPAYPSAHSCVSGAATAVLSTLYPATKPAMDARVAEAGVSRIYAGLHYRFDITAGNEIGFKVAALAMTRTPAANTIIPLN